MFVGGRGTLKKMDKPHVQMFIGSRSADLQVKGCRQTGEEEPALACRVRRYHALMALYEDRGTMRG